MEIIRRKLQQIAAWALLAFCCDLLGFTFPWRGAAFLKAHADDCVSLKDQRPSKQVFTLDQWDSSAAKSPADGQTSAHNDASLWVPRSSTNEVDIEELGAACTKKPLAEVPGYSPKKWGLPSWLKWRSGDSCEGTQDIDLSSLLAPLTQTEDILRDLTDFSELVKQEVGEKAYRAYDPLSLQTELAQANAILVQAQEMQLEEGLKKAEEFSSKRAKLKKIGKEATDWILLNGPSRKAFGFLSSGVQKISGKISAKFKKEKKVETIPIKKLLPPENWKISAIRVGTGATVILISVSGILVGAMVNPGALVGFKFANMVVETAGEALASRYEGIESRAELLKKAAPQLVLDKKLVAAAAAAGGFVIAGATAAASNQVVRDEVVKEIVDPIIDYLSHINNFATEAFPALPFVPLIYQSTSAAGSIVGALGGYEKSPEILKKFEQSYQEAATQVLDHKKKKLIRLLEDALLLSRKYGKLINANANPDLALGFAQSIHCLCVAMGWVGEFSDRVDQRFKERIKYLDSSIKKARYWRKTREKIVGLFGKDLVGMRKKKRSSNLKQSLVATKEYSAQLETEYTFLQRDYLLAKSLQTSGSLGEVRADLRDQLKKVAGERPSVPIVEIEKLNFRGQEKALDASLEELNFLRKRNLALLAMLKKEVLENNGRTFKEGSRLVNFELGAKGNMASTEQEMDAIEKAIGQHRELRLIRIKDLKDGHDAQHGKQGRARGKELTSRLERRQKVVTESQVENHRSRLRGRPLVRILKDEIKLDRKESEKWKKKEIEAIREMQERQLRLKREEKWHR